MEKKSSNHSSPSSTCRSIKSNKGSEERKAPGCCLKGSGPGLPRPDNDGPKKRASGFKGGIFSKDGQEGNKMESFLNDLVDFSKKENDSTREILKKLDKETKDLQTNMTQNQTEIAPGGNLEKIIYSKKEMKEFTEQYNENISKFYTFSQSGKEFLHKNLSKGMKEI